MASGYTSALLLKLAPVSGEVTFRAPKLKAGSSASAFEANPLTAEELLLPLLLLGSVSVFLYAQASVNYFFSTVALPVVMRATPTVSRTIGAYGNLYLGGTANASAYAVSANMIQMSVRSNAAASAMPHFRT